MIPIIFNIGPLVFRSYGVFLAIGYIFGTFFLWKEAKKEGLSEEKILDLSILVLLGSLLGARIFYALLNWSEFSSNPFLILAVWEGGLAFHGALLLGTFVAWYFIKKAKWSFFQIADIAAFSILIASAFGKFGAFLSGADLGTETKLPWGIRFFGSVGSRHPVQIYEILFLGIIALILLRLKKKPVRRGVIFFSYLILSSLGRFILEFFRSDSTYLFGLKVAQMMSFILVIIGLVVLYYLFDRPDLKILIKNFSELAVRFIQSSNSFLKEKLNYGYKFLQRKASRN